MGIVAGEKYWVIESGGAAFALGVDDSGLLLQTYWGPRLPRLADYPAAQRGEWFAMEHPIQHSQQDVATGEAGASDERTVDGYRDGGPRGFVLRFVSAESSGETLSLTLRDAVLEAEIVVEYEALPRHGLVTRRMRIVNAGTQPLHLNRALSGSFYLPHTGEYLLNHLDGRWGDEYRMQREPLVHGVFQRESRRITTSHGGVPYFAMERAEAGWGAREEAGELWFGTLEWSGNWKLLAERTRDGRSIVHLGVSDHDFVYDLLPGESFTTPRLIFGYTAAGFGAMSRSFHDFVRQTLSPRPNYLPPVVYNSWYATLFDVNAEGQAKLAEKAAAMGVEMFVIDDGWFDKRVNDRAGLGDWWPDKNKFPHGLKPLADAIHARGMQFGLWIEPEMVNPDSDLYRAHPDWIIHFPERERTLSRNQSMLNLGRVDVQDYLIDIFDRLLSSTRIDFIKWDMNRNVSEPGWPGHDRDQREIWVRYVEGLYRLWSTLRERHPDVIWENCSGGGGRVDMGMMRLTEQSWASDTTVPTARLEIQEGYSQLFPANTMAAWVTDEHLDQFDLDLRFHASMAGALGVGGNLLTWSDDMLERAAGHVAAYKSIRELVAGGDLYRLRSARRTDLSAFMYVAKDKSEAVLFAFRILKARIGKLPLVFPAGLDPEAIYADETGETRSGAAWNQLGIQLKLKDLQSTIIRLRRV
ncbi:MAG: alpha-galactosidase [Devosia sp.]